MDFLNLEGKNFVVFGVANRRSIAYHIAMNLEENGGRVFYVVHSQSRYEQLKKGLLKGREVFTCDVSKEEQNQFACREVKGERSFI